MDCFGDEYSEIYDLVYHDKDYSRECDFVCSVFELWARHPVQRVIDFGCGTGNHALGLADRGIKVTGVDWSMNMLAAAQRKAMSRFPEATMRPDWRAEIPCQGEWDAAIAMFSTVNYLPGKRAVVEWLGKLREVLTPGGLVLVETWNGSAVAFLSETRREKKIQVRGREIVRRTEAKLDWRRQMMDVEFTFFEGGEIAPRVAELHQLFYYTPVEISEMAFAAGLVARKSYPSFQLRRLELNDFSAVYVLQKL